MPGTISLAGSILRPRSGEPAGTISFERYSVKGGKYALEASIRRDRRQLRVNMRLIDGQTGLHVWAESFERPSSDLMSVRDTFVEKSVLRLRIWFEHAEVTANSLPVTVP